MQQTHALARLARLAVGALLLVGGTADAAPITLDQALDRATRRPSIATAAAAAEAARHAAAQADSVASNPELSVAIGPRFVAGERTVAYQLGIAQAFELGGKRAARRDVAAARTALATAEQREAAVGARLEAWRAFQAALIARERVAMAEEAEQVAVQVEVATRERKNVGFGTQLELNLTTAEVGRARHERLDGERRYASAVAALATAIGAGAEEALDPAGALIVPPPLPTRTDELLVRAQQARPAAALARAEHQLATAEVRAARSAAVPDLSLGVSYGYERDPDATAQTLLGTASIGLPIFQRNQGARRAARSLARRADLVLASTTTEIQREVRVALTGYKLAREAVLGFNTEVNERLHENLELARASYTSGKVDYFQFNVVRRELLASRSAYLDAFEETVDAWAAVQHAVGGEVTP